MFALPPVGHKARELFDVADVVPFGLRWAKLPPILHEARRNALRAMEADPAVKRIVSFVIRMDDELQLVSFGRRGGAKVEWRFGKVGHP